MSDPKLLYLRSPIIYEILPPGGNIIIIVNCTLACITTVYNIFNDMRWNFFFVSLLSIILPLIRHFSMLKL